MSHKPTAPPPTTAELDDQLQRFVRYVDETFAAHLLQLNALDRRLRALTAQLDRHANLFHPPPVRRGN